MMTMWTAKQKPRVVMLQPEMTAAMEQQRRQTPQVLTTLLLHASASGLPDCLKAMLIFGGFPLMLRGHLLTVQGSAQTWFGHHMIERQLCEGRWSNSHLAIAQ